jgi:hypothetical protein
MKRASQVNLFPTAFMYWEFIMSLDGKDAVSKEQYADWQTIF